MSSPAVSVSSTSSSARDQMGHQGGQPVVVPEADLVVGDGVVLVDHRDHAQLEQPGQGLAGVEVLLPVDEVERGQQHLAGGQPVPLERVVETCISRCWPTADTAWSVARSVGRGWSGARADQPAAMAPELTTTTLWPACASSATSPASLSTAAGVHPAAAVVTDEEPILTTTVRAVAAGRRRRCPYHVAPAPTARVSGELRLIAVPGEGQLAEVDHVAVAGPGPGQGPVHAEAPQPALDVVDGLVGGEVGEGHGPLGRPAHDRRRRPAALDLESLGQRPVDHDGPPRPSARSARASATRPAQSAEQLGDPRPGHRRDGRCPAGAPAQPRSASTARSALDPTTSRGRSSSSGR